jgi:hypothetical protein
VSFGVEVDIRIAADLSTVQTGIWCPVCFLPCAVAAEFDRSVVSSIGVSSERIGRGVWCEEHGAGLEFPAW